MQITFSWTSWEFWVLALLLFANLVIRRGETWIDTSEIISKLGSIEEALGVESESIESDT